MMQNTSGLVERSSTFIEVYCQYKSKGDTMEIFIEIKILKKLKERYDRKTVTLHLG